MQFQSRSPNTIKLHHWSQRRRVARLRFRGHRTFQPVPVPDDSVLASSIKGRTKSVVWPNSSSSLQRNGACRLPVGFTRRAPTWPWLSFGAAGGGRAKPCRLLASPVRAAAAPSMNDVQGVEDCGRGLLLSREFRRTDRETPWRLPPSLQDRLPDGQLARFVVDTVDQLDPSDLTSDFGRSGKQASPPAILRSLQVQSCATGLFSSRQLERATHEQVAFRFIAANLHPGHDTIAAFRKRFTGQPGGLVLQMGPCAGVATLGRSLTMARTGSLRVR